MFALGDSSISLQSSASYQLINVPKSTFRSAIYIIYSSLTLCRVLHAGVRCYISMIRKVIESEKDINLTNQKNMISVVAQQNPNNDIFISNK